MYLSGRTVGYKLRVGGCGVWGAVETSDGRKERNADVNLVFVERSVVIDGQTGLVHVQSLIPMMAPGFRTFRVGWKKSSSPFHLPFMELPLLDFMLASRRLSKIHVQQVLECKHHLSLGSSYELCSPPEHTPHTHVTKPVDSTPPTCSNPAPTPLPFVLETQPYFAHPRSGSSSGTGLGVATTTHQGTLQKTIGRWGRQQAKYGSKGRL